MKKETTRQKKVAKLLQKEISELFLRNRQEFFGDEMVTITTVRPTPDLSMAKVYLSFFKPENGGDLLKKLNENQKNIRHAIATKLRNELRIAPHLNFYIDDTQSEAYKMDYLLDSLRIPPPSSDKFNPADYSEEYDPNDND